MRLTHQNITVTFRALFMLFKKILSTYSKLFRKKSLLCLTFKCMTFNTVFAGKEKVPEYLHC